MYKKRITNSFFNRKQSIFILIIGLLALSACNDDQDRPERDYRQEMRNFVVELSTYAKAKNQDFIIIPQNGTELITIDGEIDAPLASSYLNAIDGVGREDLFYGYNEDNELTPENEKNYLLDYCLLCADNNLKVLVTDYCSDRDKMDHSYRLNQQYGFISFAAPDRELSALPIYPEQPFDTNSEDILQLEEARNFLYLINPENFNSKEAFFHAIEKSNYDLILIDIFFNQLVFTPDEVALLKKKPSGNKRLVLAYMSIGEAEEYRYYWNEEWDKTPPSWLEKENPKWKGNYKVHYWHSDWKEIIFGTNNSYLDKLLQTKVDGVYLDIIDAFEYFEEQ